MQRPTRHKSLVLIPARWNSTRFPGKPLYEIAGKPLLRRVWERCLRARKIDRTIIATDDMRIAEAAFNWGAEVSLTSTKHRSGTDRIAEVVSRAKEFSIIINVQGDEPLIDPRLLDRFVLTLQKNLALGMVTAAHPFENPADALSPHQVKVVTDLEGNALYFSRAPIPWERTLPACRARHRGERNAEGLPQDAANSTLEACAPGRRLRSRPIFLRHQGVYGFRRDVLLRFVKWRPSPLERAESLEQLRALENGVTVHVLVTKQGSPGIDTPADGAALERNLTRTKRRGRG